MAGEVGLEPTVVCRRRLWRPVQSPLCDSPIYGGADENRTRVQNHLIIKYLFTHYLVFMYSFKAVQRIKPTNTTSKLLIT